MEQDRTDWAAGILSLNHKINTTFRSRKLIHQKKCDVFNILVDCTAHYVQLWWMGRFREEINTKSAEAVGKELLKVLERGRRLLQRCGEKDFAKSDLIICCSAGEFCEIVDDVERYSSMMNKLITRILEFDRVDKPDKKKLIKQLQDKVKLDCSMLQDALTSAHTQDCSSLDWVKLDMQNSSSLGWVKNLNMKSRFKHYLKMLVDGRALHPFAFDIAYNDLKLNSEMPLGSGSYGSVCKGLWCETIPVAIKQFFYDDTFESEYTMLRELFAANSSHIIQVFGHSEVEFDGHGSRKIIVMELMDMDLKKLIEDKKKKNPTVTPFSAYESSDLMLQIAKGLRDLHKVQVVHRDIKPSNILVKTADGRLTIKLADFGETKAKFQTKDNIHTKKKGTSLYMAPEMAAGDEGNYSKKVDVYSYGRVCMEILTGEPPNSAMLEDLLKQGLCTALYTIISNCLEVDPDKRPSFEEICDHLWAFKESILIIPDEVPSYIDERELLNFRMYTKTLGEECISMMPRISTPTGRRAIYCLWAQFFGKGVRHLPIDSLVDIELSGLRVESSGQIKFTHPWLSVGNPFIGTGVEPQNHLSGNLQQDLGIFGQFKKLVVDQGKKLNLSFCIERPFSDAFSTDDNRTRFIDSVLELCRAYPIFNGLLIQWVSYVEAENIFRPEDGENFVLVLERLRSALPPGFVIGVGASRVPTKAEWPIERASHLFDQIQLLPDPGDETAQHTTNLYSSSHQSWSFDEAVQYYISRGVDSSKLFITAVDVIKGFFNANKIGKPAPNAIYDLCPSELVGHGFVERWDDEAKSPYAYHPQKRLICVYDNVRSIKEKVAYIKANNLGGVYISHCPGAKACSRLKIVHDHLTHGYSFNSI